MSHFGTIVARGSRTHGSSVASGSLRPFGPVSGLNVARGSSVGCWAYKSGLKIFVRAPEVPFLSPKFGHFWQKCPYLGTQKWHFQYPNENFKTTFISPTSPKNGGFHLKI